MAHVLQCKGQSPKNYPAPHVNSIKVVRAHPPCSFLLLPCSYLGGKTILLVSLYSSHKSWKNDSPINKGVGNRYALLMGTECHHPHSEKEKHIATPSSRKMKLKFSLLFGSSANYNALKMGGTGRLIVPSPLVQLHRTNAEESQSKNRAADRVSPLRVWGSSIPGALG